MSLPAPFAPLVSGGAGLDQRPGEPLALAARMAEVYGVAPQQVLPVRGATHALELVWRLAARERRAVQAPDGEPFGWLNRVYVTGDGETLATVVRGLGAPEAVAEMAASVRPALLVVDEGAAEFSDHASAATLIDAHPNLVVLRSLSLAYGLAGAPVGAALAQAETLERLRSVLGPQALAEPLQRLALQALDPSRALETRERIQAVRRERERVARALGREMPVEAGFGPVLVARPADLTGITKALAAFGVEADVSGDRLRLPVSARSEVNDRLLAALGLETGGAAHRTGEAIRDTKETRIVCAVDLDAPGPIRIETGVGFFDHMLEQVAAHGGFSLRLKCEGDLHIDPHHTVEDSAIALGQALKSALGERKGIARYGFVLPMDEAEAKVSIDLSGRPYPVFEGRFDTAYIGDYRTDLTAHVFRSLAEHLGAAIHVSVTGNDDHHKTEACFKAFGRALRQAIRVEGEAVPSTKGVL
jgi:imidazoleglycerol-phosphate dehydratase / histidinol-phosphatase